MGFIPRSSQQATYLWVIKFPCGKKQTVSHAQLSETGSHAIHAKHWLNEALSIGNGMNKFGKSQPIFRNEDTRFLTGKGTFVDSISPGNALHAHFFRSPVAHANIKLLDLSDVRQAEGVHLVLGADDLIAAGITKGLPYEVIVNRDCSNGAAPQRSLLADGKVRFVGEPLVLIVADTHQQALNASELIRFEFDTLPTHMLLSSGGEPLHKEAPTNRASDWSKGNETNCNAAFDHATHVVNKTIRNNRIIVNTLEPRACFAEMIGDKLHVASNTQGVWVVKNNIVQILGLEPVNVQVTTPDVGGGFGMKAMSYPEPVLVAHAAKILNRAIRWTSDRLEAMLTDNGARDLDHDVSMAFDEDYQLTGYRVDTRCNLGAYNSDLGQYIQTDYFAMVLTGALNVQDTYLKVEGFFTNTAQTDAYRGAGRAEAIYLLERMMDYAARELGVDIWDCIGETSSSLTSFPTRLRQVSFTIMPTITASFIALKKLLIAQVLTLVKPKV